MPRDLKNLSNLGAEPHPGVREAWERSPKANAGPADRAIASVALVLGISAVVGGSCLVSQGHEVGGIASIISGIGAFVYSGYRRFIFPDLRAAAQRRHLRRKASCTSLPAPWENEDP